VSLLKSDHRLFLIEVKDTGPGIPADKLRDIFTPFTQVHHNERKSEGSGLGLALTKKITEALGGTIEAKSNVGQGSVFSVKLPLKVLPRGTLPLPLIEFLNPGSSLAGLFPPEIRQELEGRKGRLSIVVLTGNPQGEFSRILGSYLRHWNIPFWLFSSPTEMEEALRKESGRLSFSFVRYVVEDDPQLLDALLELLSSSRMPSGASLPSSSFPPFLFQSNSKFHPMKQANERQIQISQADGSQVEVIFCSSYEVIAQVKSSPERRHHLSKIAYLWKICNPTELFVTLFLSLGILFEEKKEDSSKALSAHPLVPNEALGTFQTPFHKRSAQLPVKMKEQEAGAEAGARAESQWKEEEEEGKEGSQKIEVLVVEDNQVNQLIMKKVLGKCQVHYKITPSAEEAVEIWKKEGGGIPLILMDVEVEGPINGLEATAMIREEEARRGREREKEREKDKERGEGEREREAEKGKKEAGQERSYVVVMTGRSMEKDHLDAKGSGCDLFLTKPVLVEPLQQLVNRVVSSSRSSSRSSSSD